MAGAVFADEENNPEDSATLTEELSLYTTPRSQFPCAEARPGPVEQSIAALRRSVEPYTFWCQAAGIAATGKIQEAYNVAEPIIQSSAQVVRDGQGFLKDPPAEFYPSMGVTGFSGILGLYLARGYRLRRLIFPTVLMALSASVFYPQHTMFLSKVAREQLITWSSQGQVSIESLRKKMPSISVLSRKVEKTDDSTSK
ncbi:MICOS complex subunit MIC26-like isoform X2 [Denticeps clupeoides]|nr:MICOS complex subunit MIC26-like isoform X2 [Denticeps clupeoides]